MEKKKLFIDKEAFCDWYFDEDICEQFFDAYSIFSCLKEDGVFSITLKQILENVGYLPENVIADGETAILDEHGEIDMCAYDEILFSNN